MLIPLDLFQALDKNLRNDWIQVGPKMSDEIYTILTPSESDQFKKVRTLQLAQKEIEDTWDKEIVFNTPSLYKKHIEPHEERSKKTRRGFQIQSRL